MSSVPRERAVSFGFEDVVSEAGPQALAAQLDRVDANAVHLAVGRMDWTAFPWRQHPDGESGPVRRSGVDYLARALQAVLPGRPERRVSLTVDALAPAWLRGDPRSAGIGADGSVSELFPSATALLTGDYGRRLLELVDTVAERYQPDQVVLTE